MVTFFARLMLIIGVTMLGLGIPFTTLLWIFVQRAAWHGRWFERLLDLEEEME